MPDFLPGAVFAGITAVLFAIVLRVRAGRVGWPVWKLALAGVAAAWVIPHALALLARVWAATPGLPGLPMVTAGQVFLGAWTALLVLAMSHRPGRRPLAPLWAGLLMGVAAAALVPPLLDRVTGSYQPLSLRADVNHCTQGMTGQVQPGEVANICDEPITVGLCLPGEVNPAPCAQSHTLQPGGTARFDPGGAGLSSLPANPGGLTVVACRPPARPSRMLSAIGRGYEGVCLPPG